MRTNASSISFLNSIRKKKSIDNKGNDISDRHLKQAQSLSYLKMNQKFDQRFVNDEEDTPFDLRRQLPVDVTRNKVAHVARLPKIKQQVVLKPLVFTTRAYVNQDASNKLNTENLLKASQNKLVEIDNSHNITIHPASRPGGRELSQTDYNLETEMLGGDTINFGKEL